MEQQPKQKKSDRFFAVIKNLFFLLLFLQFAPVVIMGIKSTIEESLSSKVHVGYLAINGPIVDSTFYIKKIDDFAKDTDVKGLILKINSPGGYSGTCQAIFNELKRFKKNKPVVSWIENTGASGAYYIAATSNTILASPISLVGSIGVFMEIPNVKDLLTSWKIQYRYVQSGTYKTAGSAVKELSEQELVYLQALSDSQYEQFTKDIAQSRNLNIKDHKKWADGKAFTGNQGLALKLIDKLGSFNDAQDEMKKILKTEHDLKLVHAKKVSGFMKLLSGDDEFGADSVSLSDSVASFMHSVWTKFSMHQQTDTQPQLL